MLTLGDISSLVLFLVWCAVMYKNLPELFDGKYIRRLKVILKIEEETFDFNDLQIGDYIYTMREVGLDGEGEIVDLFENSFGNSITYISPHNNQQIVTSKMISKVDKCGGMIMSAEIDPIVEKLKSI